MHMNSSLYQHHHIGGVYRDRSYVQARCIRVNRVFRIVCSVIIIRVVKYSIISLKHRVVSYHQYRRRSSCKGKSVATSSVPRVV